MAKGEKFMRNQEVVNSPSDDDRLMMQDFDDARERALAERMERRGMPEGEFPPADSLESVGEALSTGAMPSGSIPFRPGDPAPLSDLGRFEYDRNPSDFTAPLPRTVRAPAQRMEPMQIKGTPPNRANDATRLRQLEAEYKRNMDMMRETIRAQDLEILQRGRQTDETVSAANELQRRLDEMDREMQSIRSRRAR
tara:strand:+ start:2153 stop:2737 length:585 start_codon:yes stop_codon:yes gene_type:complete